MELIRQGMTKSFRFPAAAGKREGWFLHGWAGITPTRQKKSIPKLFRLDDLIPMFQILLGIRLSAIKKLSGNAIEGCAYFPSYDVPYPRNCYHFCNFFFITILLLFASCLQKSSACPARRQRKRENYLSYMATDGIISLQTTWNCSICEKRTVTDGEMSL